MPLAAGGRRVSRNNECTEVECVVTRRARRCDPEGVCGGVNTICRLAVVGLAAFMSQQRVPLKRLQHRPHPHPQHHYPLPDPHDSYQVLKSLALGLGGEFRRHGDDFSISDDYGPAMGKMHQRPTNSESLCDNHRQAMQDVLSSPIPAQRVH